MENLDLLLLTAIVAILFIAFAVTLFRQTRDAKH